MVAIHNAHPRDIVEGTVVEAGCDRAWSDGDYSCQSRVTYRYGGKDYEGLLVSKRREAVGVGDKVRFYVNREHPESISEISHSHYYGVLIVAVAAFIILGTIWFKL